MPFGQSAGLIISNAFLETLMLYHMVLFIVFIMIYKSIEFEKHFTVEKAPSWSHIAYFTLLTQTTVMAGEITPKTKLGRSILATHVFLSWFVVILSVTPVGDALDAMSENTSTALDY